MTAKFVSVYSELTAIGAELDHHESDLYVKSTPEARDVLVASGWNFYPFRSPVDGLTWLEVPFGYEPFWKDAAGKVRA